MLVFRSDESGFRPSFEGLRDFGNAGRYNPITPSPSLPAWLYSRLAHGSTRSHHAREPVGPGALLSASSPEAARPSPQEAPPPPSAPRVPPGHTTALRVRVCVYVYHVWYNVSLQGPGRVQIRCSRCHSIGGFIQGFGPKGVDLDESHCGASCSPPVHQADHMCQKLSLRATKQPVWKIFPLECF